MDLMLPTAHVQMGNSISLDNFSHQGPEMPEHKYCSNVPSWKTLSFACTSSLGRNVRGHACTHFGALAAMSLRPLLDGTCCWNLPRLLHLTCPASPTPPHLPQVFIQGSGAASKRRVRFLVVHLQLKQAQICG